VVQSGSSPVLEEARLQTGGSLAPSDSMGSSPVGFEMDARSDGLKPIPTAPSETGHRSDSRSFQAEGPDGFVAEPDLHQALLENPDGGLEDNSLSRALSEIQRATEEKRVAAAAAAELQAAEKNAGKDKDRPTKKGKPVMTAMEAFEHAMGRHGTDKFSLGHVARAVQAMETPDFPVAHDERPHETVGQNGSR